MNKFVITAVLASLWGFAVSPVIAKDMDSKVLDSKDAAPKSDQIALKQQPMSMPVIKRDHLFEERAGTWKATCDKMENNKVYCRMFHIEQFGEWKTKNFVQLGPAWSPEAVGFVVATYLGFKEGTTVSIGIDKNKRHEITAPKGNNLMLSPEVTENILEEMENGNKIVTYFHSHSGVRQLTLADLGAFKELLVKVKEQMAKNDRSSSVK